MQDLMHADIRSIAVLRALKLGDFLVATPAFRALRAAFPSARIDYIGLLWARDLVIERYRDYFSGFVDFPGFPGLPEREWSAPEVAVFLRRMQQQRYDLALQLHGRGDITNVCVDLWDARMTAGLASPGSSWLDRPWFVECPEELPEVRRLLFVLRHCGISNLGEQLLFPIEPQDEQELAAVPAYEALGAQYVCIHPGAASSKPWPARSFAAVADACAGAGYAVAITGAGTELEIANAVARHMSYPAAIFSGQTSLGVLAALLQGAELFIGNDTGAAHLAVAVGTPSVVIFSTSDPKRWASSDKQLHLAVLAGQSSEADVIRIVQGQLTARRSQR